MRAPGSLAFNLLLMATLLAVLWTTARPHFLGGHLIALVAGFTLAVLALVMLREYVLGRSRRDAPGRQPGSERARGDVESRGRSAWRARWGAVGYTALLFSLVYTLGTLVGSLACVATFLVAHRPGIPWLVIALTLLVGGVVPYMLISLLGLRLWEGVVPPIIPGWLGGGVPPPF